MGTVTLDRTDHRILEILQREGDISNVQLAARVNLSPAPCLRRVAALKEAGIILRTVAQLDPRKFGFQLLALVSAKLVKGGKRPSEEFHQAVGGWPEVTACYAVTGDMDYLLLVRVTDLDRFSAFMNEKLLRQSGVIDVRSSIVIDQIKETSGLPIEALQTRTAPARKRLPRTA